MDSNLNIRLPSTFVKAPKAFAPPTLDYMEGTWYVTHSSLPLWKNKCNVSITYEILPAVNGVVKLDDLVKHQASNGAKVKTVNGIDTPSAGDPGTWDWRGKGWLKIASSHWECLGFGTVEENQWMVTYFAKTLFTPAGIDVYSRKKEGLPEATLDQILEALNGFNAQDMKKLTSSVFEIPRN